MKRFCAFLLCITLLCTLLPAGAEDVATPTDIQTDEPADPPVETEEPAEMDTPAETEKPAETDTPAETEAPAETASPDAWDESTCDHANIHCAQAPACGVEGCAHIVSDANGLDVPLCELGRWVLNRQDTLIRAGQTPQADDLLPTLHLTSRRVAVNLNTADATLWRSGNYTITGGADRPEGESTLTIVDNRAVILKLTNADIGVLQVGQNVSLTLDVDEETIVRQLVLSDGAKVTISGRAALTIGETIHRPKDAQAAVIIRGTSVLATLQEAQGRQMFTFPAEGMTRAEVNGQPIELAAPHADGYARLWLSAPAEGMAWTSTCEEGLLSVTQEAVLPEEPVQPVTTPIQAEAGMVYEITGSTAAPWLTIDVPDVTVVLNAPEMDTALVAATAPWHLVVREEAVLTGSQPLTLARVTAEQPVTIAAPVDETVTLAWGRITLLQPAGALTPVAIAGLEQVTHALINGEDQALLLNEAGEALLPAPPEGQRWLFTVAEDALVVEAQSAVSHFQLTDSDTTVNAADAERFTVRGNGSYVTGSITAAGSDAATALLEHVQLQGREPVLVLTDEQLSITLRGDCGLVSTGEAISLAGDSALSLNVVSGRLLLRNQSDLSGITLSGNIKVEPETDAPHPVLTIRDGNGNPVPNRAITLKIGEETYNYITHFDGTISLWGLNLSAAQAVAASDDSHVYSAVLVGGSGEATPGLTISDVAVADLADGGVRITWQADGAGSEGVQYIAAAQNRDIPDTWFAEARQVSGADHIATLTDLGAGSIVSLRVYATAAEDVPLTADTADGFQFSEIVRHTHLAVFKPEKPLDVEYTGKAYVCPVRLPDGAKVTYTGQALENGMPVQPGKYTLRLTIPEGNREYQAGEFTYPFEIKKAKLVIHPDPNQEKYEGDEEPELTWTVTGLLPGDEVQGLLTREEGEDAGNYAFLLDGLTAKDYYELVLAEDAPVFTILPFVPEWDPTWSGEVLIPIVQEITKKDGRTIAMQLKTSDELHVGAAFYGWALLDPATEVSQLFSPSLSWNEENDTLLLRLRCLPQLNEDKGYDTLPDGSLRWGSRELRLSWRTLRAMQQQGIDAITVNNNGAQLTLPLCELMDSDVSDWIRRETYDMNGAEFRIRVEPVNAEPTAVQARQPLTEGWQMSVTLVMNSQTYDMAQVLTELRDTHPEEHRQVITAQVDMEPVADLLGSVNLYDEDTFPDSLTLINQAGATTEAAFVTPFHAEETEKAIYARIVYTHRYLQMELGQSEAIWCAWAEE